MFKVNIHPLQEDKYAELTRVVCVARYNGKWVFCKHKERDTWEIPGGHIEPGEDWTQAATRELFEETGATQVELEQVSMYSISTYGLLCYAEIKEFEPLPESEIELVALFDDLPQELTYPDAHTLFFNTVKDYKKL